MPLDFHYNILLLYTCRSIVFYCTFGCMIGAQSAARSSSSAQQSSTVQLRGAQQPGMSAYNKCGIIAVLYCTIVHGESFPSYLLKY